MCFGLGHRLPALSPPLTEPPLTVSVNMKGVALTKSVACAPIAEAPAGSVTVTLMSPVATS